MKRIFSYLTAAALLGSTAVVAQAQDTQGVPPSTPDAQLPSTPSDSTLPPSDPRLDPNAPDTLPPQNNDPLDDPLSDPADPVGPPEANGPLTGPVTGPTTTSPSRSTLPPRTDTQNDESAVDPTLDSDPADPGESGVEPDSPLPPLE